MPDPRTERERLTLYQRHFAGGPPKDAASAKAARSAVEAQMVVEQRREACKRLKDVFQQCRLLLEAGKLEEAIARAKGAME